MPRIKTIAALLCILTGFSAVRGQNNVTVTVTAPSFVEAGSEFIVSVKIKKGDISGFAKLELYLPVGFEPESVEKAGATFIVQSSVLKHIWIDLPETPVFELSFKVKVDNRLIGYKEIYGSFHFIKGKERQKVAIAIIPMKVNNKNPEPLASVGNTVDPGPVPKKLLPSQSMPNGLSYRVQIGAFSKKVPKAIMQEFYYDADHLAEEEHGGLYKYTIGYFSTIEDADKFRKSTGVYGAFVVKYLDGVRQ
jgi:hypothetical protein